VVTATAVGTRAATTAVVDQSCGGYPVISLDRGQDRGLRSWHGRE
jgi:hypothetical protein